jgi:hypothetical protein
VDSKEDDQAKKEGKHRAAKPRISVLPIYQPGFAGGLVSGTF